MDYLDKRDFIFEQLYAKNLTPKPTNNSLPTNLTNNIAIDY